MRAQSRCWIPLVAATAVVFVTSSCGAGKTRDTRLAAEKIEEATVELSVGDPLVAHELLAEAAELDPRAPGLHLLQGDTFLVMERLAEAEAAYRLAIEEAPGDPMPRNNLGVVYREQGHTGEAKRVFEEVVSTLGPDIDAEHNLGLIALDEERWENAIALFEGVVERDEKFAPAHYGLAIAYERVGRELDSKRSEWRFELHRAR